MMQTIRLEQWQQWVREGCTLLPIFLTAADAPLPESWRKFFDTPAGVLLESAQTGRYTYCCDRPARIVIGGLEDAEVRAADGRTVLERRTGRPLEVLQQLLAEFRVPVLRGMPPMTGGWMGVFGYDVVHSWEKLPWVASRDLDLPLYALVEAHELFVFDHLDRTLHIVVWSAVGPRPANLAATFATATARARAALARWQKPGAPTWSSRGSGTTPTTAAVPPPSFSAAAFQAAVRRVQEYIAAGHTYQVNLSLRASRVARVAPERIYEVLRRVNPSPYMGLLRLPAFTLVCGSPELLVRSVGGVISSRPIAGTRPRGEAPPQDTHFSAELFASAKERAEHLMLVDLIRNDLGRVAEFGSVHVAEFMALERYSHVMHIVSQVEARLQPDRSWADVLRAMFPGGTITGCPKIRTMEIIEELEPVGRGFYTGALGWIACDGAMEMNIVIRSMLVKDGVAHVQAGAGIVADSKPERELDEALRKAQALWVALDAAALESDD